MRDEGVAALRKAIELDPGLALAHNNLGNILAMTGDAAGGVYHLRKAIALRPKIAGLYVNLAAALHDQHKLNEAATALSRALEIRPGMPAAHFNRGRLLDEQGKLDPAVADFQKAVHGDPGFTLAYLRLGQALEKQGKLPEAEQAIRQAVAAGARPGARGVMGPLVAVEGRRVRPAEALYALGRVLKKQKRLPEAETAYRQAIAACLQAGDRHDIDSPHDLGQVYHALGNLLAAQGKLHEAEHAFGRAIAAFTEANAMKPTAHQANFLRHDLAQSYRDRGRVLGSQRKDAEAEAAYRAALRLNPDDALAHHNLGLILVARCSFDEAITHFRAAVRLQPDRASAYLSLGAALCDHKRDYDGAIAALGQAMRLLPDSHQAYDYLGTALLGKRDYDGAIAAFRHAVRLRPADAMSHCKLGSALAAKHAYDEAISAFRDAIHLNPSLFDAHFGLGKALADKGAPTDAVGPFQTAVELQPDHAPSHSLLGDVLRAAGRPQESMAAYRQALELWRKLAASSPGVASYQSQVGATLNNLALGLLEKANPAEAARLLGAAVFSQKAALKMEPQSARYRQFLRNHYWNLAEALVRLGKHGEAARAAVELPGLYPDGWQEPVRAAGFLARCAALAAKDPALPVDRRSELVEAYGGQAVALLRRAVANGWREPAALKGPAFEPLRRRDDFRKLQATLEATGKHDSVIDKTD
jgi:tetratricopeptide (TPR) repeat protein